MDHNTWIVVADASKAKIFSAHKARLFNETTSAKDLTLVNQYEHAESRKKDIDLVSDKQGNFGSGTFVDSTEPKRHEEERFAHEIGKIVDDARKNHHFQNLILIAPPVFMGMLNKSFSDEAQKLVIVTIEKNYTQFSDNDLLQQLKQHL